MSSKEKPKKINYQELTRTALSNSWNIKDDLKGLSLEEIRAEQAKISLPHEIVLLNVTGDLNVGSILRSAVLFGFRKATIFGRRKYDKRSTVGAQNYIDVDFVDGMKSETEIDEEMFFKFLNSKPEHLPCFIEYVENYSQSVHILGVLGQTDPLMLIFGNEGLGIPEIILDVYKDSTYSIPQRGVMRSLNVAAAAAIAMYETVR